MDNYNKTGQQLYLLFQVIIKVKGVLQVKTFTRYILHTYHSFLKAVKRAAILLLFLSATFTTWAQAHKNTESEHHSSPHERSLTLGIAAPYSFNINSAGINLRMYHNIGAHVCFGPEYSYFKSEEAEIIDFDFIGHYIFETQFAEIYPLLGANYTVEKKAHHQVEETKDAFGLIFGVGMHRSFKGVLLFIEYSNVEFGIDDQFITLGLMHTFK
ncbi:MAG: hypothetical protein AAGI23_03190 [Bacteroidota bacterium]